MWARTTALIFYFCLMMGMLCGSAYAGEQCSFAPNTFLQEHRKIAWTLKKGVNMAGFWQNTPREKLRSEDIDNIRKLGFSFVRIPVSELWLNPQDVPSLDELRCDITRFLNAGLAVVVDFHPSKEESNKIAEESSEAILLHLVKYWQTLAGILSDLPPDKIYLGLMNEPSQKIANWWYIQERLINKLRPFFPKFTFIATDRFGLYGTLKDKTPYADKNVLYDFHFYTPMFFTHHNARWLNPLPDKREERDNVLYPALGNLNTDNNYEKMNKYIEGKWDKEKLEELLKKYPIAWRTKTGAKIVCLEFGVYRPFVDDLSRQRWLKDVRELLEKNDIPWALWNYRGGYGLYFGKDDKLDFGVVTALDLNGPVVP